MPPRRATTLVGLAWVAWVTGAAGLLGGIPAGAEVAVCGDANRDGVVTDVDGVIVLRAAALLGRCDPDVCDVDGDGAITDIDGVIVLRKAALIPFVDRCPRASTPSPSLTVTPTPTPSTCGNGLHLCDPGETCCNCKADCQPCPSSCGDGRCDLDENCLSCPCDCPVCAPF